MNVTYKVVLDKRRLSKKGKYPLKIRLYQKSHRKELGLGISIREIDWEPKSETVRTSSSKAELYNAKISTVKNKIQKQLLLAELENKNSLTLDDLYRTIKNKPSTNTGTRIVCFLQYARSIEENLINTGNAGNALVYRNVINKLTKYFTKKDLPFDKIDYKFIDDYNNHLLQEGLKINGISIHLRTIRAIYNRAIREGVASYSNYPFKLFKIKSERTINRTLSVQELKAIVDLTLQEDSATWHWRNIFLLSFYLTGVNMADLLTLTPNNIIDGRVVFRRKKTHKVYSIKIQKPAEDIFNHYTANLAKNSNEYILPVLKGGLQPMEQRKAILQAVHVCNNYLKRFAKECNILKPVSSYYARYTWANIARKLGYSKDLIAEALGHDYGNKVTGIYLEDYDMEMVDDMNLAVIQSVLNHKGVH